MNKKTLSIVGAAITVVALAAGAYFYFTGDRAAVPPEAEESSVTADTLTESSIQGTLPSIGANPLAEKPNVNPAEKANPFKSVKTNPFE